ncbi:hypothetical protein [Streptomyces sp. cmx-4-9]|uniref:hypothetical protein n=1 Tax=Streptomyces sp. cmx-4-9 TaxID=2790941 RepID=UPI00397E9A53
MALDPDRPGGRDPDGAERAGPGNAAAERADGPDLLPWAVEALAALDRATLALREEAPPESRAVAHRIINAVRAETRLGALLLLDDPAHDLRIAESAAAKILRQAVDSVPGARAASCRLIPTQGDDTLHTVALTIAAALDRPLPERIEEVRRAVFQAAHRVLGIAVATVDLTVDAALEPTRLPDRAPHASSAS